MFDVFNRLFGTTADGGATWTATALDTPNSTRPRLSENWLDLSTLQPLTGPGVTRFFEITVIAALTSGTNTAEVEFQLVGLPVLPAGSPADTTFTFVDGDVSPANDTITETAHGLPDYTRVQLSNSGGALPAGLSATQTYFVRDAAANTFKLATTPGGAVVDITAAAGTGTHTVTWFPEVIASSGGIPVQRCTAGTRVALAANPFQELLVSGVPRRPSARYLFGRVLVTADLTGGSIVGDLREQPPSPRNRYFRSALSPLGS